MLTVLSILILFAIIYAIKEFSTTDRTRQGKQEKPLPSRELLEKEDYLNPQNPSDQLKIVSSEDVTFIPRRIMEPREYKVFNLIEKEIIPSFKYFRVFAQVCMGEILASDKNAYKCINSKRVDILIIDGSRYPVLAIEYQGKGHYQNDANFRDMVKKEAFRKAGVEYVEIMSNYSDEDIRYHVTRALERRFKDKIRQEEKTNSPNIKIVK